MSINCLCQIKPTNNSSWIKVYRKHIDFENMNENSNRNKNKNKNKRTLRQDEQFVYLPNTIGICQAIFKHEIDKKNDERENENDKYKNITKKKSKTITPITYYGMESEKLHEESRALKYGDWAVWNTKTKSFSRPIDFKGYFIIKFPKDYWDFI